MQPLATRTRAYFAPVDRSGASPVPVVFDPAQSAAFALDAPPAPWIDAGWVQNFTRRSTTKLIPISGGARGAAIQQFRRSLSAEIELDFMEWGKLQMALSAGSQQMNVLACDAGAGQRGSGGTPLTPVALLSGSTSTELVVGFGAVNAFATGDLVAADLDYQQQTGYVGTGIPAAYVSDPADVQNDVNYVRRVTFNVGRVRDKTETSILLAQPLPGGAPAAGASVQKVIGFVDREGGSFFSEWSALFVTPSDTGATVFYYYPRVQSMAPAEEKSSEFQDGFDAWALHARLLALPSTDLNDSEEVLCYRSLIPATTAALF
jgi:hypothetical protein